MEIVFAAILGLVIGSFLNVLIFRTKAGMPITGRSQCRGCRAPIAWYDLIPVLSYVLLKGRCRQCAGGISLQYPAVEATTAFLFAVAAWQTSLFSTDFLRLVLFTVFLIILFVYDLKYGYILDQFSIPGMVVAILLNVTTGAVSFVSMLVGALLIGGFFALQFAVSKGRWIGGGDIRMGIMMGLMLGWQLGLVATMIAYVIGAIFGIGLILFKGRKIESSVPFGTFLAIGTFVTLLWGQKIIDWYLGYLL